MIQFDSEHLKVIKSYRVHCQCDNANENFPSFFPEDTNKIRKESLPKEGENSSSIDSIADNSLTDVVSNSKDELQMDRRVSISFYYHNFQWRIIMW